jgi:hypothetical protein
VAAVEGTGRKALLIAGTIISVCMAEPSLSAIGAGYRVFAVVDASGTYSKMAQEITLARVVQAGVIPVDTAGRLCRTAEDLEPARRRAVGRGLQRCLPSLPAPDREPRQSTGSGDEGRRAGFAQGYGLSLDVDERIVQCHYSESMSSRAAAKQS